MKNKWKFAIAILISLFLVLWLFSSIIKGFSEEDVSGNVAVIEIQGYITSGESSGFFENNLYSSDIVNLIKKAALPVKAKDIDNRKIFNAISHDKKFPNGINSFVLPDRLGHVTVVRNIPVRIIQKAIKEISF